MINRVAFYNPVRNSLFNGHLSQDQVDNLEAILNEYERMQLADVRQLAYVLGTVYHETFIKINGVPVRSMAPVEEIGKGSGRKYGQRVKYNGKPYTQPFIYYGRGHTQNTWWDNYYQLTKVNPHGWDFLNHPDLLLQIQPSVWAMFYAMRTGLYTGKKLSDYFNSTVCDWKGARRIINGQDCADKIATYSKMFLLALV